MILKDKLLEPYHIEGDVSVGYAVMWVGEVVKKSGEKLIETKGVGKYYSAITLALKHILTLKVEEKATDLQSYIAGIDRARENLETIVNKYRL